MKPYHCEVTGCKMKYVLKCHLNRHMRSVHPTSQKVRQEEDVTTTLPPPHPQPSTYKERESKSEERLKMSAVFSNLFFKVK
jgi:hypothetical protein